MTWPHPHSHTETRIRAWPCDTLANNTGIKHAEVCQCVNTGVFISLGSCGRSLVPCCRWPSYVKSGFNQCVDRQIGFQSLECLKKSNEVDGGSRAYIEKRAAWCGSGVRPWFHWNFSCVAWWGQSPLWISDLHPVEWVARTTMRGKCDSIYEKCLARHPYREASTLG